MAENIPVGIGPLVEGQRFEFTQRIAAQDIDDFARLSGDTNPLHMDREFARAAGFRERVVHGAFLVALVSRLVGMELSTAHTTLLNVTLHFAAPSHAGEELTVTGTVASVHPAAGAITLKIAVRCAGELRARGSAMVRIATPG